MKIYDTAIAYCNALKYIIKLYNTILCFISAILHYTKHMHVPVPRGCWMSHNGVFERENWEFPSRILILEVFRGMASQMFLLPFSLACFVAFAAFALLDFCQIAIPMGVLTSNTGLGCDFGGRCGAIAGCHEFSAIGKCNTFAKTLFFCNFQFNFPTLKHVFLRWIVLGRFNPSEKNLLQWDQGLNLRSLPKSFGENSSPPQPQPQVWKRTQPRYQKAPERSKSCLNAHHGIIDELWIPIAEAWWM